MDADTYNATKITYLDEYYLTNHEIDVLEAYAEEMAAQVPAGAMVVELGSGLVVSCPSHPHT